MRVLFTSELLRSLDFGKRPGRVDERGNLIPGNTPGGTKDWVLRDSQVRGLGVRVTKGSKSFFVQRKMGGSSTSYRYTLDKQHQKSLPLARAQAQEWLGKMAANDFTRGEDKRDNRAARRNTFGLVYESYVPSGVGLKPASIADRRKAIRWLKGTDLWDTPLLLINEEKVNDTFKAWFDCAEQARAQRREKPNEKRTRGAGPAQDVATCHKCLTHCLAAWNFAEGLKPKANPFATWRKRHKKTLPKIYPRTKTLPSSALGKEWLLGLQALRSDPEYRINVVADYLMIVLLWGGRKTETASLRWSDISEDSGFACFAATTSKGRKSHYLPLCSWAASILRERRAKNASGFAVGDNDLVFPSTVKEGKPIEDYRTVAVTLERKTGLKIGAHDLRRTLATEIFGKTLDVKTVSIALGHSTGSVSVDYIQQQIEGLRPLFIERETRLRRLLGLEAEDVLTEAQRGMLEAARTLLKQAGLSATALQAFPGR